MPIKRCVLLSLLSVLLLSLTACIGGTTAPPRFYLLEPVSGIAPEKPAGAVKKPVIMLQSVRIPHYVDRPQIVTATGKNAYQLSELDRWAEPLDHNISRVLAQNLALLVPADVVFSNAAERADLRVSINILELHAGPQGQAGLIAQWQIRRGGETPVSRQASYHASAPASDYPMIVAALNECIDRLSRDLAADLQRLGTSD